VKQVGSNVNGVEAEVANLGDLDRRFEQIRLEKGKLDIVFAKAGIAKYARLGIIDEELFDSIFDGNVKKMLFTVQKALPLLPDDASIIFNASVAGKQSLFPNQGGGAFFARTSTSDLKARRIRVNAISPGPIDRESLGELRGSAQAGQDRLKSISSSVSLGRIGTPDEIAKAVVFLASDDSSFMTGIELFSMMGLLRYREARKATGTPTRTYA
jgi:NAD(P)-dependent dehydrogenase (short-subunit alcohol dehydrogenase family)